MISLCTYRDETFLEKLSGKYSTVKTLLVALVILGAFACLASL